MRSLISCHSGLDVSWPFLNLPARKLTDYYHLIKTPESLKRIEKKVRGIQGRDDPTGITMFKSWAHFEDHVSLIWRNAREYNEDGSEISNLANVLEVRSHLDLKANAYQRGESG